jgi:hypothetical protein
MLRDNIVTKPKAKQPKAAHLLEALKQLPPAELRKFKRQFASWQTVDQPNGQLPGATPTDEERLIQATKIGLPVMAARRLKKLQAKSEAGTLTESEWTEYGDLAKQAEQLAVLRVSALAELVRRRGKTARAVMKEIGWRANSSVS